MGTQVLAVFLIRPFLIIRNQIMMQASPLETWIRMKCLLKSFACLMNATWRYLDVFIWDAFILIHVIISYSCMIIQTTIPDWSWRQKAVYSDCTAQSRSCIEFNDIKILLLSGIIDLQMINTSSTRDKKNIIVNLKIFSTDRLSIEFDTLVLMLKIKCS